MAIGGTEFAREGLSFRRKALALRERKGRVLCFMSGEVEMGEAQEVEMDEDRPFLGLWSRKLERDCWISRRMKRP